ncbi:MAG: hypothetical protein S4CHLAM81_13970 [Chlamydiales bacterium]|nr:hypothetical protein [Chlamydiales bacterium]MCH9636169.1 hypothetical protein [Chlamydiales bacterium]
MKAKGFIYKTDSGQWVLASEPNLKSCCLGKEGQLILEGNQQFNRCAPYRVYTVKGTLQGDTIQDAKICSIEPGTLFWVILFITLLALSKVITRKWPVS